MTRYGCVLAVAGGLLLAAGCGEKDGVDRQSGAPGQVAVIDLDKIAAAFGKLEQIRQELEAMRQGFLKELAEQRDQLQKELDDYRKEVGDSPTDEQKRELAKRQREANQQLQASDRMAGQRIAARQAELIGAYQEQIKPIAKRIARERGMTIVVMKGPPLLIWDESADITEAVLAEFNELIKSGAFTATTRPAG